MSFPIRPLAIPPTMPVPQQRFVTVNDVRINVLEWGTSRQRPLLLLHGGSAHARWWDFFALRLAPYHRLIAADLRGHGDSGWAPAHGYQIAAYARDVIGLVTALELSGVILVAHSFGALVAVAAASALDAALAGLVLIDSACRLSPRSVRYLWALSSLPHPTFRSLEEAIRRFRLLPTAHGTPPEVLAHVARHAVRPLPNGGWVFKFDRRALAGTEVCDLVPNLRTLHCPLLIVRGAESRHVSPRACAELIAAAPQAQQVDIPGAHHHVMLDAPDPLAERVGRFAAHGGV